MVKKLFTLLMLLSTFALTTHHVQAGLSDTSLTMKIIPGVGTQEMDATLGGCVSFEGRVVLKDNNTVGVKNIKLHVVDGYLRQSRLNVCTTGENGEFVYPSLFPGLKPEREGIFSIVLVGEGVKPCTFVLRVKDPANPYEFDYDIRISPPLFPERGDRFLPPGYEYEFRSVEEACLSWPHGEGTLDLSNVADRRKACEELDELYSQIPRKPTDPKVTVYAAEAYLCAGGLAVGGPVGGVACAPILVRATGDGIKGLFSGLGYLGLPEDMVQAGHIGVDTGTYILAVYGILWRSGTVLEIPKIAYNFASITETTDNLFKDVQKSSKARELLNIPVDLLRSFDKENSYLVEDDSGNRTLIVRDVVMVTELGEATVDLVLRNIPPEEAEPPPIEEKPEGIEGKLDVVLCIDKSGSMIDDINAIQLAVDPILASLDELSRENNISFQVGLVTYTRHDETNWLMAWDLTPDVNRIRSNIQSITIADITAGGSGNEDIYGALMYGMNQAVGGKHIDMGWRPGAAKIIFPIGDEPPDDPDWEGRTLDDIARVAFNLDPVHMYPLITPKLGPFSFLDPTIEAMERLAQATDGEVVKVGCAEELPEAIVATVKLAMERHANEIWRRGNPPYVMYYTMAGILIVMVLAGIVLVIRGAVAQSRVNSRRG